MDKLAIVIPAYKEMYFEHTLESIANQTCQSFTVYIGDDCGHPNIENIVDRYRNRMNIKYVRFAENMGGENLVGQWERCIDLIDEEEWIWLFSDDDIMDANCVEFFFNCLGKDSDFDLFHFDVTKIDDKGFVLQDGFSFPAIMTVEEFALYRLKRMINSFAIEYVFRKSFFLEVGKFQRFDLGWCSDDATWIKLGSRHGIRSISNAKVYWRVSRFNISPNMEKDIIKRKLLAEIDFAAWLSGCGRNFQIHSEPVTLNRYLKLWFYNSLKVNAEYLPGFLIDQMLKMFRIKLEFNSNLFIDLTYRILFKLYFPFKRYIKLVVHRN